MKFLERKSCIRRKSVMIVNKVQDLRFRKRYIKRGVKCIVAMVGNGSSSLWKLPSHLDNCRTMTRKWTRLTQPDIFRRLEQILGVGLTCFFPAYSTHS